MEKDGKRNEESTRGERKKKKERQIQTKRERDRRERESNAFIMIIKKLVSK